MQIEGPAASLDAAADAAEHLGRGVEIAAVASRAPFLELRGRHPAFRSFEVVVALDALETLPYANAHLADREGWRWRLHAAAMPAEAPSALPDAAMAAALLDLALPLSASLGLGATLRPCEP